MTTRCLTLAILILAARTASAQTPIAPRVELGGTLSATLPYGQTPGAPGRNTSSWRRQARSVRTCFHRNWKPIRDFRKSWDQACTTAGWPINPGLYAGRIGDRVKIGQSMNVAQRVDSFKFEELIGLKPFVPSDRRADEHPEDHALAVKRELMTREREIHTQARLIFWLQMDF